MDDKQITLLSEGQMRKLLGLPLHLGQHHDESDYYQLGAAKLVQANCAEVATQLIKDAYLTGLRRGQRTVTCYEGMEEDLLDEYLEKLC